MKNTMWIALALLVASAAAVGGLYGTKVFLGSGSESEKTAPAVCEAHGVARCPFCDPSLLESMGFCSGHGVPEAICTRCRDDLEEGPAFAKSAHGLSVHLSVECDDPAVRADRIARQC